jgi:glycosyltransferase involved in cell wall biosynthesis
MISGSQSEQSLIALFSPTLSGGGAERVLVNLACGLCARGYRVDVVLASAKGQFLSDLPQAAQVVDLGASRVVRSIPALAMYLRRRRPYSLLAFQDHAGIAAVWARFLVRSDTRIISSVHNVWSRMIESSSHPWKSHTLAWLTAMAYQHATAVVAVSNGVAEDMAKTIGIAAERVTVIYNPVITPELLERSAEPLTHPWFDPNEPAVIMGIGRLTEVKDFPTLLRAFARVRAQQRVRLIILGEGTARDELEKLVDQLGVKEDVLLPGFVANPYPYLKRASIFVLSSLYEGLPTVLIEAMALGVPCVATDCDSGPSEILAGGLHGTLTPVRDVDSMAAAIAATLHHPRAAVSATAWQPFTLDAATDAYERVLA